jgi:hypothetical protein
MNYIQTPDYFSKQHVRKMSRVQSEAAIQRAVIKHLHTRGVPHLVFVHVPNGGKRPPIEAAILKSMGVRAGASDLLLWHDHKFFALELKTPRGRLAESQQKFLDDMETAGGNVAVAVGLDDALRILERWQLLRGCLS